MTNQESKNRRSSAACFRIRRDHAGFTLIELLVVIAIIALLIAMVFPTLTSARESAMLAACMSKMRQNSVAYFSNGTDNKNYIANYNWPVFDPRSPYGYYQSTGTASIAQLTNILETTYNVETGAPQNASAHILKHKSYFLLAAGGHIDPYSIRDSQACPADEWADRGMQGALDLMLGRNQNDLATSQPIHINQFLATGVSSYWNTYASFMPDTAGILPNGFLRSDVQIPSTDGNIWSSSPSNFTAGLRRYVEVRFPSQKAFQFEVVSRHVGPDTFFGDPAARVNIALFDGSVSRRDYSELLPSWQPNAPESARDQPTSLRHRSGVGGEILPCLHCPDGVDQYYQHPPMSDGSERYDPKVFITNQGLRGRDL